MGYWPAGATGFAENPKSFRRGWLQWRKAIESNDAIGSSVSHR